jgi:Protein of unknown function (DUF1494)
MKKRSLSLIEMVISLTLLSLLITALLFWYHSITKQKEEFNHSKWPLMEERYAYQRLQQIFPTAHLPFFTTQPNADKSLIFIFDRGPSPEPKLSNQVLARLYYDAPNQRLCLGVWPFPRKEELLRTPSETLLILDKVVGYEHEFYHPPDPYRNSVNPEEVGRPHPIEQWQGEWHADYKLLPALLKLTITRKLPKEEEPYTFEYLFDLPIPIIFPKTL